MEMMVFIALGLHVGISAIAVRNMLKIDRIAKIPAEKRLLQLKACDTLGSKKDVKKVLFSDSAIPFDIVVSLN